MESLEKFDAQKKRIEENMAFISENISKVKGPIFVELVGTAKSGKTTLTQSFESIFTKQGIPFEKRRETAEYNPIENKDLEEYNIWMIMELFKNLSEDTSNETPRIVLYDRGILDRFPWIDYSVEDGSIPEIDAKCFKTLYATEYLRKYEPITYGFLTSPELSVQRKGKPGRLVNVPNVRRFNGHFMGEQETIKSLSSKYTLFETDPYQGDLKGFIMDVTDSLSTDIREVITERLKVQKKDEQEGPEDR